ncbi:family 43 glycosylhydrolase [Sphingobacterium sp. DN00404]|uniref:Family 43 glycosylhydrolase n=1 Tax=Sphingobacterium micropteri TaxID=2763501 RepID=A0ABR7YLM6_9SPHI|nr:glycoside hydrolase family 43 protein [Sphingobacterium micropteri]MBD1432126.1 family 43 glycosylhydrolase [Sphingobacterium micropteri]
MNKKQNNIYCLLLSGLLLLSCHNNQSSVNGQGNKENIYSAAKEEEMLNAIPLADPFILYHDHVYYAYGTSSDKGFEVFLSDDLHEWKKHPEMLLKKENSFGEKWFWAPEVYYNEAKGKFYLFYSAEEHICVATSNSPLGPFRQEIKKPMLAEKGIDSSLFIDDDGTPYLYFVRFTNGNVIWVAELEDDWETIKEETLTMCIEASTEGWEAALGRVTEGASVLKRDGLYYMLYSGNDFRSPDYGVGYATSSSPIGPWQKSDKNPILQNPQKGLTGTGHGAYFQDQEGAYKYVFHAHHDTTTVHPRFMHIANLSIEDKAITIDENSIWSPKTNKE